MGISSALGSSALLPAGLGFRNVLINGGFDIWQRTTSSEYAASATAEYKAPDRWWTAQLSTTSTLIVSRQPADTTNFNYGCRVQRKSGQTGTGAIYFGQTLETVTSKSCAGRQVTLSFYAKKGANAVSTFEAIVYGGKGTDQTSASLFSTGWTSGASLLSQTVTPTTTMTRYTYTFAVDSTYTQLAIWFKWTPSGTANADDWFQFEGVQLEQNYQPTPFEQRPIGVELALCQRYYEKSYRYGTAPGTATFEALITMAYSAAAGTSGELGGHVMMNTYKRIPPNITWYDHAGNINKCTRLQAGVANHANQSVVNGATGEHYLGVASASGAGSTCAIQLHFVAECEL